MEIKPFKIRDKRRKGFFIIDNEFIDMIKEIGGTATAIYLYLCKSADNITQESFPSQETMAEKLGIHRDTVIDKLKILEKFNLIKTEQTKELETGKWLHNTYTLLDKTVWIIYLHGNHVGKTSTRFEANTVSTNSDTNYTNILTTPIEKIEIGNNLRPSQKKALKEARSQASGRNFAPRQENRSLKESPRFPVRGGVADGTDIY